MRSRDLYRRAAFLGLTALLACASLDAAAHPLSVPPSGPYLLELPGASAPAPAPTPAAPVQASAPPTLPAPPTIPAKAAMAAGSAAINAQSASQQSTAAMLAKNPDVMFAPTHLSEDTTLLFRKSDMNVIIEALAVYDRSAHAQKQEDSGKNELSSLLNSLKGQKGADDSTPTAAPLPLPNLYLGSIVYYTPSHWSVWINSRKLTNRTNQPGREIYITRLSRDEVELVWKPTSLLDTPAIWQRLTDNGTHPIPRINVDERGGAITLVLRPNQTFLPRELEIREGLIKPAPAPTMTTQADPQQQGDQPSPSMPGMGFMHKSGVPFNKFSQP